MSAGTPSTASAALLGVAQIVVWGGSFFLLTVLAAPIHADTGWSLTWIYGALTVGALVSGLLSPRASRRIARGRFAQNNKDRQWPRCSCSTAQTSTCSVLASQATTAP